MINSRKPKSRKAEGFTLIEAMVAISVITLVSCYAYWTLAKANEIANVARLYTAAQEVVKTQIDLIQGDSPFVVIPAVYRVPTELSLGTATKIVAIYSDPTVSTATVSGTLTTVISDISDPATGQQRYYYRADVTLTYTYRGHSYQVVMSTIRRSDL